MGEELRPTLCIPSEHAALEHRVRLNVCAAGRVDVGEIARDIPGATVATDPETSTSAATDDGAHDAGPVASAQGAVDAACTGVACTGNDIGIASEPVEKPPVVTAVAMAVVL